MTNHAIALGSPPTLVDVSLRQKTCKILLTISAHPNTLLERSTTSSLSNILNPPVFLTRAVSVVALVVMPGLQVS